MNRREGNLIIMAQRLADALVRHLPLPEKIIYDGGGRPWFRCPSDSTLSKAVSARSCRRAVPDKIKPDRPARTKPGRS